MGNNASIRLRTRIVVSRRKQRAAGEKLRNLARLVREEHQKFHKAKMASGAVGAAGGAVAIGGILLGPVTGGVSMGMVAAGAATGIISGAGELATSYIESKVLAPKIEEAQAILNQIMEETLELVEATNRKISRKQDAIDFENCFKNNVKIVTSTRYGRKVTRAVAVINKTLEANRLSKGIPNQQFDICDISDLTKLKGSSADKVRRGVIALKTIKAAKAAKSAGKVAQSAGKVAKTTGKVAKSAFGTSLVGLGLVLDIKCIIDNSIKIANNDSEVADLIDKIADLLTRAE